MKKRCLLLGLVTAVYLFTPFETSGQSSPPVQQDFDNYITISNGNFNDGDSIFKPLCINYLVDYACYTHPNTHRRTYYIAPCFNYSDTGTEHGQTEINGTTYDWHWCYGTDGQTEMNNARAKRRRDLRLMDSLGFNVVRISPAIRWDGSLLKIPTGTYSKYFELTDTLIAECARNNLRVILVLSDKPNTYDQLDQYCVYLDSVTRHYSNNKTVMAYVIYMEPGYKWKENQEKSVNDKLMISNWSRKWYYIAKRNAPNQLVTYGLDGVNNVLFWDPSALTCDFLSMHFYGTSDNPIISATTVAASLKWMNDNVQDMWVLGETGFSGTLDSCNNDPQVGTEIAQYHYANHTMQKSLDCGCKGYAWWQYQEVNGSNCRSDYFGIVKHYPNENLKTAHSLFPESFSREPKPQCDRPSCYYNLPNYPYANINGVVLDQDSHPIKDAYVVSWSTSFKTQYSTFTDSQGRYTISTPNDTVLYLVWASQKGYTSGTAHHIGAANDTLRLTHINYDHWQKNWTNRNYPVTGDNPVINNSDCVMVGNFCGDEAQELLLVKPSMGTASLYRFHINHWVRIWNGSINDWQISSTDKFYAGDFNGDGYDEVLCVQNVVNGWANIYHFVYTPHNPNNPWQYVWTNSGNGHIGNWTYGPGDIILPGHFNDSTYCSLMCIRNLSRPTGSCQRLSSGSWETLWSPTIGIGPIDTTITSPTGFDRYYVGDFNGDGIDELLCTDVSESSNDMMKLIRYDNGWNTLWTNNGQSEGVGIYPYRNRLLVGNFDSDPADEILGIYTWATKFDLNINNQWDWSWSNYGSGRLSDWAVNPNHRIFFMKVMKIVPDYLFVARGNPNTNYRFDGYSLNP